MIKLIFKFLSEFANFWEIFKLKRFLNLSLNLKGKIKLLRDENKPKQERLNAAFEALECVLKYRRENRDEFDEIFTALEKFATKRKSDKSIDEDILRLWK